MIRHYSDLRIYQISYRLALLVHHMTQQFPDFERYELSSQLRRAAISIPLNIAEGYGKKHSQADFKRFLNIALGSNNEVKVLLDFSKDLGYLKESVYEEMTNQYDELGRQIYSLLSKWK